MTEKNVTNTGEQLWDAKNVANFLNVSRAWVYARAEAGLLPHLRVGNLIRFEPQVLREFVREDRESSTNVMARIRALR